MGGYHVCLDAQLKSSSARARQIARAELGPGSFRSTVSCRDEATDRGMGLPSVTHTLLMYDMLLVD